MTSIVFYIGTSLSIGLARFFILMRLVSFSMPLTYSIIFCISTSLFMRLIKLIIFIRLVSYSMPLTSIVFYTSTSVLMRLLIRPFPTYKSGSEGELVAFKQYRLPSLKTGVPLYYRITAYQ